ncbi:MAG TPA: aminodeoxychorismate/anthranilate synthase component II [Vicinamibacterales bacterium]|jgi:anthranilate synthase/aminodeoxychorismate synthase-like glutamine amidotransferase|nr:aminodeoxychorismate/anthranilate synthase component II [Vicinamibacterales bacterium]
MILLIDNYDSFVHNLARYVRELGEDSLVRRNDQVTLDEIQTLGPSHIIISPGPCSPAEAGISTELVQRFGPSIPILGVCLGHQCIGAAYGGDIVRAGRPRHGMTSPIAHDGTSVFDGLPSPFRVTRYHSLVIARNSLPSELRVTASASDDGEIMAVEHRTFPVVGVQFHPESAATEYGYAMLDRFLHGTGSRVAGLPAGADGGESVHRTPDTPPPWGSRWEEAGDSFVPPPVDLVR